MLHLEKINRKNIWEILKLKVSKSQKNFVASNDLSIIEAYLTITSKGVVFPFGIYDGDRPVGFLMIGYDVDETWENVPNIAKENYTLWRLMIDETYQQKGFGKEAEYCWLSYEPENKIAKELYHSFGFVENGDMDGDEVIAILKL